MPTSHISEVWCGKWRNPLFPPSLSRHLNSLSITSKVPLLTSWCLQFKDSYVQASVDMASKLITITLFHQSSKILWTPGTIHRPSALGHNDQVLVLACGPFWERWPLTVSENCWEDQTSSRSYISSPSAPYRKRSWITLQVCWKGCILFLKVRPWILCTAKSTPEGHYILERVMTSILQLYLFP